MEPPIPTAPHSLVIEKLRGTQPWLRFIGIMMMIATGILVLASLAMVLIGFIRPGTEDGPSDAVMLIVVGILYFLLAIGLYLYPAILLLRSARRIRQLSASPSDEVVAEALEAQRKFWKYAGICVIVMMALYALAILLAIALPALRVISGL